MIKQDYKLQFQFDSEKKGQGKDVYLDPAGLQKFYITQSIDSFLPTISLKFKDPQGVVGRSIPSDKRMSNLYVSLITTGDGEEEYNSFYFKTYRRFPDSSHSYELEGLLDVEGLFSPDRTRGWNKNIVEVMEELASEMTLDGTEISQSLSYIKSLIQPGCSNIELLTYLRSNLEGKSGEVCYYCFVKNVRDKSYLVFKSLEEMIAGPIVWKFLYRDIPDVENDLRPIFEYKVYDNGRAFGIFGSKEQAYSYFDYSTGTYVSEDTGDIELEYPSLSEKFLIDKEDPTDSISFHLGRSNDFTQTFRGRAVGQHYRRLNGLVNLWITTWGIQNAAPGDVVKLYFPEPDREDAALASQYSGLWLVRKVIHSMGYSFFTRLLLSRCGVDVDDNTSLLEPREKKYSKR